MRRHPIRASLFCWNSARRNAPSRGLGYRGIYLGGHLRFEDYERILALLDNFAPDDTPGEFYFFERDEATGLCSHEINREYRRSKAEPPAAPLAYRFSRMVHDHAFADESAGFRAGRAIYRAVERTPASRAPCMLPYMRSKSWSSIARIAGIVRCRKSPTFAPNRSAPRTSATGRAAAPTMAFARLARSNASGHERTIG
jgi:hypothetical protein